MNLYDWSTKWNIPIEAIADLKMQMGMDGKRDVDPTAVSEAGVSQRVRLEAAQLNVVLWRNNIGAFTDDSGNFVRYGLANDSSAMNKQIKSSDLIGLRPGGQFVSREVKAPDWKYTGTAREKAQLRFLQLVLSMGGDAAFVTGRGSF